MSDIWQQLGQPFPASDIEWRVQRSGVKNGKGWAMVLAYVTNRAIQQRLDDVVGPENWKNEYSKAPDDGVLCGISVRVQRRINISTDSNVPASMDGESEWITKYDGAENTTIEAVKGGLSGAMKRAAVQWGIGRYLYNLESNFVEVRDKGDNWIVIKYEEDDKPKQLKGYWNAPALPEWALPTPEAEKPTDPVASTEAPPPQKPVEPTITEAEAADLLSMAKAKGYTTKESAVEFLNAFTLGDFTKLKQSDLNDIKKALLQHHREVT